MTGANLPPAELAKLQKLIGLIGSPYGGERDAAIRAATHLLEKHGLKWCEVLSLPAPIKREPLHSKWRLTCTELAKRPAYLRPWERKFVADLPAFLRISTKQRYVLFEIADRVLGERAP
jgi:hypothetical protein